jgi:hypothetical protein
MLALNGLVTFARSDNCMNDISAKRQVIVPLLGATCQGGFHLPRQALSNPSGASPACDEPPHYGGS